jgi:NAD(P)-dependent dehydrogenase (short-subunit alcohol dehydrogenase family)
MGIEPDLHTHVGLVTGPSRGIRASIVLAFAEAGAASINRAFAKRA